jgi:SsrA-binding protein
LPLKAAAQNVIARPELPCYNFGMTNTNIATNKKAFRDFFLSESWEAGIALNGGEVKSIRAGYVNFKDSFARVEKDEIYLYNLYVNPYAQASFLNLETDRPRKLLLHKKEIQKIEAFVNQKKLALVPTRLYFNNRGFVKVELSLGKGKRQFDRREDIKKRDIDRALKRVLKVRK